MRFPGFVGNERIKRQLSAMADAGRLPHAVLLQGANGCGKRTLAKLIAEAILCACEGEKPCGMCEACRKIENGSHPDVFIASGGEGARSFHVESIRFIRSDVNIVPNEGKRKVYILANASSMTEQAQNALLKIMEEPPSYACFSLTCESASQMLPTILSRAVLFSVEEVEEAQAVQAVGEALPEIEEGQIREAYGICSGNIGRMKETLLGGVLSRAGALCNEMVPALLQPEEYALLRKSSALLKDKELTRAVFSRFLHLFQRALLERSGFSPSEEKDAAVSLLARKTTRMQLSSLIDIAREGQAGLDRYANHPLLITRVCSQMRAALDK
mgnify:CR=1 FL=1